MHSAEDSFLLEIGGHSICISGDKKLLDLIPVHWNDYRQLQVLSSGMDVIRLEEKEIIPDKSLTDGWHSMDQQAIYVQNCKVLFSLQSLSDHELIISVKKALDSYIRIAIHYGILQLLYMECIGLHGVTLLCGNEIIILSAPSGTGKTTLAHLLEQYCDAIIINGDFALLRWTSKGVIFEPTPFCGTSGRSLKRRVRVNRLVFLEQSKENRWHTMGGIEAVTQFMSNVFIPSWDCNMQLETQKIIMNCISELSIELFSFAPEKEAAEVFFKHIVT